MVRRRVPGPVKVACGVPSGPAAPDPDRPWLRGAGQGPGSPRPWSL